MQRVAIIGGGISGLTAAFYLEPARQQGLVEYELFEAGPRLGGVIRTERKYGCLIEAGPDSFLTAKAAGTELCRDLNVGGDLLGSRDEGRRTYVLVDGRLVPMPDGLQLMVPTRFWPTLTSPLFSFSTKWRMFTDLFRGSPPPRGDESVAALVERHYGKEAVERLADPLLAGIYGGMAERLSARAVLPQMAALEEEYGGLSRGVLLSRRGKANPAEAAPLFTTFRNGMEQLVEALWRRLYTPAVHTRCAVRLVQRQAEHWEVVSDRGARVFDAVLFAVPAQLAALLLRTVHPGLSEGLGSIPYTSSVTAALGFARTDLDVPPGFGFLVPRTSGMGLRACTFVHQKFPGRAPDDVALLRVFLGGAGHEEHVEMGDEELVQSALLELEQCLRIRSAPRFSYVFRWRKAMAQYDVGHLERIAEIERRVAEVPGLHVIGNGLRGIGIPDCIREAKKAAEKISAAAASTPASQRSHSM